MTFLIRYAVTGLTAVAILLSVLWLLVGQHSVHVAIATSVGYTLSTVVSYVLQRSWVFRSSQRHAVGLPRFLIVVATGFVINITVTTLGVRLLHLHYLVAQTIALTVIPVVAITANSRWTFNDRS